MIKCSLIDITTDNRAVICIGEDPHGKVMTTPKLSRVDYQQKILVAGGKRYDFSGPMLP